MEWYFIMLLIFGSLIIFMLSGMPVAFAFFVVTLIGSIILWGVGPGLEQYTMGLRATLSHYTLLPIPLFVLMGEVMLHSGLGTHLIDAVDKCFGRLPGRLSLMAVAGGTVLATLTGSGMTSTAVLASMIVPEMEKRGYNAMMSVGPIIGSGGLAIMIPPSGMAVFIAILAGASVNEVLMGTCVAGILMAILYASYIFLRCRLQPWMAPPYEVHFSRSEKVRSVLYILPMGAIVFLVTGVIVLGIATPTEAAATGAAGTFMLSGCYRLLNWEVVKRATISSIKISTMILMIFATASAFSQILAYTQVAQGLMTVALSVEVTPIVIVIIIQLILFVLGCFMLDMAIAMILLPVLVPIVNALGLNMTWFVVLFMLNMEMGSTTPPFGMYLFAAKAVLGERYTLMQIALSGVPFLVCDAIVLTLLLAFPQLVLWLPGLVR